MSRRDRILAVICVVLHAYILWNVYQADKLTPRILRVEQCQHKLTLT